MDHKSLPPLAEVPIRTVLFCLRTIRDIATLLRISLAHPLEYFTNNQLSVLYIRLRELPARTGRGVSRYCNDSNITPAASYKPGSLPKTPRSPMERKLCAKSQSRSAGAPGNYDEQLITKIAKMTVNHLYRVGHMPSERRKDTRTWA